MKIHSSIFIILVNLMSPFQSCDAVSNFKNIILNFGATIKNNKYSAAIGTVVFVGYSYNVYKCRDQNFWPALQFIEKQNKNDPKFLLNPTRIEFKNIGKALFAAVNSNYNKMLMKTVFDSDYSAEAELKRKSNLYSKQGESWGNALKCMKFFGIDQKSTPEVAYLSDKFFAAVDSKYSFSDLSTLTKETALDNIVTVQRDTLNTLKASEESIQAVQEALQESVKNIDLAKTMCEKLKSAKFLE